MRKEAKITSRRLRKAVEPEMQNLLDQVAKAVNEAPGGRVICDSEEVVRDLMAGFRQRVYEKAIQL